jgi:hypothetical protein
MRSRSTPINHRKAMPANGSRCSARLTVFQLTASHVPASCGLAGTDIRMSTRLMMSRVENTIPATAAARGVFKGARVKVRSGSILSSLHQFEGAVEALFWLNSLESFKMTVVY